MNGPSNTTRINARRRRMSGGSDESLPQGRQFLESYPNQRQAGGAYTALGGAPVVGGDQGLLEGGLRGMARVDGLDASMQATRGMSDQSGGRRRRRKAKGSRRRNVSMSRGRNNSVMSRGRNNPAMRRGRNNAVMRSSRRGRNNAVMRNNMYGGASYAGAPYGQSSMLLDGSAAARAGTADFSDPFAKGSA